MIGLSDAFTAVTDVVASQLRITPTGLTSDEIMVDPSNLHGHQGNNDDFVLNKAGDNFQLFRSHDDLTLIHGHNDIASYWGGGTQTIFDDGVGSILRFSELDGASVKIYDFQNDPTGKIVLYNPTTTAMHPDGHGGTMLGYLDFVGDPSVPASRISVVHTLTNPSQGGLI